VVQQYFSSSAHDSDMHIDTTCRIATCRIDIQSGMSDIADIPEFRSEFLHRRGSDDGGRCAAENL